MKGKASGGWVRLADGQGRQDYAEKLQQKIRRNKDAQKKRHARRPRGRRGNV